MKFFDFGEYCPGVFDFAHYVQLMTLNRVAHVELVKEFIMKNITTTWQNIETITNSIGKQAFIQRKEGDFGFVFFELKDADGYVQFYVRDGELRVFPHSFHGDFKDDWKEGKKVSLFQVLCFSKKRKLEEAPVEPLW